MLRTASSTKVTRQGFSVIAARNPVEITCVSSKAMDQAAAAAAVGLIERAAPNLPRPGLEVFSDDTADTRHAADFRIARNAPVFIARRLSALGAPVNENAASTSATDWRIECFINHQLRGVVPSAAGGANVSLISLTPPAENVFDADASSGDGYLQGLKSALTGATLGAAREVIVVTDGADGADADDTLCGLFGAEQHRISSLEDASVQSFAEIVALLSTGSLDYVALVAERHVAGLLSPMLAASSRQVSLGTVRTIDQYSDVSSVAGGVLTEEKEKAFGEAVVLAAVGALLAAGEMDAAARLHNALLKTLDDNLHSFGFRHVAPYTTSLTDDQFFAAVAPRIGEEPKDLNSVTYALAPKAASTSYLKLVHSV